MAQNCNTSGLNLDPISLWRFTRLRKNAAPVRLLVWTNDNVELLARQNIFLEIFVAEENTNFIDPRIPNLKVVWKASYQDTKLYELFGSIDYILCDKADQETWLAAMLCGATPLYSMADIENVVKNNSAPTVVDRIENWEKAESLLTSTTMSGITEL